MNPEMDRLVVTTTGTRNSIWEIVRANLMERMIAVVHSSACRVGKVNRNLTGGVGGLVYGQIEPSLWSKDSEIKCGHFWKYDNHTWIDGFSPNRWNVASFMRELLSRTNNRLELFNR
ncbi:hypothetical protein PHMEG_00037973 [Phytophthora megakarya]|uniref:Uncharacterized protein n=1 Tax=Phytophthora megakarya TaxID=4795 RepID=A0A225UL21_9STRA|nr:hypothetical protein PHMEG_00037973 [Phytophthora megakarya]